MFREIIEYLHMTYILSQKRDRIFRCEACDYTTSHIGHWKRHQTTRKHQILTHDLHSVPKKGQKLLKKQEPKYVCEYCNKMYIHRQSLYAHKKKCVAIECENIKLAPTEKKTTNIDNLSKQDLLSIIKEMIPQIGEKTTNINVQVFLDQKCKEAMTIQNFATQLTMTIEDILAHKQKGLSTGVSNILIENLKPIPLLKRPIHCTDGSGVNWMVHDETDGWKQDNGKAVMKEAGFGINKRFQDLWNEAYPNWQYSEMLQQRWMELVQCLNADPSDKDIETTLKKLGPECKLTTKEIRNLMVLE